MIFMGIFLTTILVMGILYLLIKQIARRIHSGNFKGNDKGRILILLTSEALAMGALMLTHDSGIYEATAIIAVATMGFYFMTLSFVPRRLALFLQNLTILIELMYVLYRGVIMVFGVPVLSIMLSLNITMAIPLLICLAYLMALILRISDVKFIIKSGVAWNSVCLITDFVYIVIFLIYVSTYFLIVVNARSVAVWVHELYSVLMISLQYAMVVRINNSSLFVFWEEQEKRFIESLRLGHSDLIGESHGIDVLYRNIYDRVIDYFDEYRPYLNNELTINDIVNVLYTNKVYISKAISAFTGRNFCQFVNYYRITYAVELFRQDTSLKIVEVASRSGFNSSVSFSMAFRLYMGEKPSDWFRRERARLSKRKK